LAPGREPSLDIEGHGEEVEHASHGGHPLDDVGDRLGLDGVAEKEEAGEEGDGKGPGAAAWLEGREVESEKKKPVEREAGTDVDEEVDQVITKDIDPSKIVVQGKGKISKKTNRIAIVLPDQLPQCLERKILDQDTRVSGDIGHIIELEWDMEGVRISEEADDSHQADGPEMSRGERKRPAGHVSGDGDG
jgi:hypothetical protein